MKGQEKNEICSLHKEQSKRVYETFHKVIKKADEAESSCFVFSTWVV